MCDPLMVKGSSKVWIELRSSAPMAKRSSPFPDAIGLAVADQMSCYIKVTTRMLGGGLIGIAGGVGLIVFSRMV